MSLKQLFPTISRCVDFHILADPSAVENEWMECLTSMIPYEKLTGLDGIFGVWYFNNYLRVTFVSKGWLVVWDHRDCPPTRYDCKTPDHQETCELAAILLRDLAKP